MSTPAVVELSESNGLSGAEAVTNGISNINFGSSDTPNIVVASHPIVAGNNSYGKWLRVHVNSWGTSTQIDTLKFYMSSGTYLPSMTIASNMGNNANTNRITSYATASFTAGGGAITTPYSGSPITVVGNGALIPTSLPVAANVTIGATITPTSQGVGQINSSGGTQYSDYIFMEMTTGVGTTQGDANTNGFIPVFTLQWNEV